jgi:hypothetical protein
MILEVTYQLGFVELYGVYHNAVVTSQLVIPVINQAPSVKSDVSVGIVGLLLKSL